jgi:Zn-finger nucleic acid-binding protein
MKCPRDGTQLDKVRIAGIEIDKCHQCDGIWFDRGELDRVRDAKVTDAEETLEREYGNPSFRRGRTEGYMLCPRCADKRLQQYTYTYMNPVRIDRCEDCFGVWLDKGELDAIVGETERLTQLASDSRLRVLLRSIGRAVGW